jgi:hypothetical protein
MIANVHIRDRLYEAYSSVRQVWAGKASWDRLHLSTEGLDA